MRLLERVDVVMKRPTTGDILEDADEEISLRKSGGNPITLSLATPSKRNSIRWLGRNFNLTQ